jgi:hypothetical protein
MPRSRVLLPCRPLACGILAAFMLVAAPLPVAAQDADGDGILDQLDPDDDNDGILDADEGTTSEPPPQTPPDSDGDVIVDDLDPDDDNNGVTDADEPVPDSPPPATGGGSGGGGGGSGGGGSAPEPDTSNSVMISALPVTGSATDAAASHQVLWIVTILAAASMLAAGFLRQRSR